MVVPFEKSKPLFLAAEDSAPPGVRVTYPKTAGRKLALKTIDWIAFVKIIPQDQTTVANSLE